MNVTGSAARVLIATALAVAAAASTSLGASGRFTAAITLPALTGRSPVGTVSFRLIDRSRRDRSMPSGHRELMVQFWYPAARAVGPRAAYMPAKVAALVEREDHLPPGTISRIRVHATADAPAAAGRDPVILYSPGSSEMRSTDTALVEDLASNGYIVVAIDHTHETELVEFPNGRIIHGSFVDTGTASNERALAIRVADTRFVLDQLAAVNRAGRLAHHLDLREIGMFGFSLGGATAAASMLADPRLRAGADLDGSIYGPVDRQGLNRPFLLMIEPSLIRLDPSIKALVKHLRGPRFALGLRGSAHESFTDFAWIKSQLAHISPAAAAQIDIGRTTPTAVADQSAYLTAFFDHYLRHTAEPLLEHPSPRHPEIIFVH